MQSTEPRIASEGPGRQKESTSSHGRRRLGLGFLGAIFGGVVGAIVGVNLTILLGPDSGYETTPRALLEFSPVVAALVFALYALVPVMGAVAFIRIGSR